ncbi:FAD/NAD(P)-binding domain-containing protein, partial [Clavulina sp. PMI_390]
LIGGGISGIAAAKACIEVGLKPHIFEQSTSLGGLWSPKSSLTRQWMQTNASKHLCAFSDLQWTDTSARRTFPTTREMGKYIQEYANRYIPQSSISLGTSVSRAERTVSGKWAISIAGDSPSGATDLQFDKLIVASGIFSKPRIPQLEGASDFPGRIIHSADFRDLDEVKGKRVAIIGDSFSAVELAAEIAPVTHHLSHVHPRPFWAFPRVVPFNPTRGDSPFGPADMVNFTRSKHKGDHENIFPSEEAIASKNSHFLAVCGDQHRLASSLHVPSDSPSFVTVSDTYLNSVRHGTIHPVLGRLRGFRGSDLLLGDGSVLPGLVDVVIMSTGFSSSMPFFGADVLEDLSLTPEELRHPALLYQNIFHPSPRLQDAAFVGVYRGPYMGVIELQAKWVAQVFGGKKPAPSTEEQLSGIELERRIRSANPPLQFPHGDYVGLMMDLSQELSIDPPNTWPGRNVDIVTAAQFNTSDVSSKMLGDIETELVAARDGKWVSAAVFNALQGDWDIYRRLESSSSTLPSGNFSGKASFTRVVADMANQDTGPQYEYKYLEQGRLTTDTGMSFDAQRRYRYRYEDEEDRIDAFFDDTSGEGHFHRIRIRAPNDTPPVDRGYDGTWEPWVNESRPGWRGTGRHWCAPDNYTVAYWFSFKGIHLEEFRISYKVKGPKKDYISTATYTR